VLCGTIGAVMVTTPMGTLIGAVKKLGLVFFEQDQSPHAMIEEIIAYATKARKSGIVSLEKEADAIQDPFLRKALNLAVDGTDLDAIRKTMELEITLGEHHAEAEAKVFEAAGGYAPTIGIIGAVLGLIQVMKNLANIEEVGHGIAVAFVATVYGVGTANLFFLPAGNKIKVRMQKVTQTQELMLEGVAGIVEGLNPKLIRTKLEAYAHGEPAKKAAKVPQAGNAAARTAPAAG
jgi:chemotaxis protein MotA